MYASLFLSYTDCYGSIGSMCWGQEANFYTLPPTPHSCHRYSTCVHSSIDKELGWGQIVSWAGYTLECNMYWAMHDLRNSNTIFFLVGDYYWMPCLDNG